MDKAFTRVDETFEAIRDSLNQQAINNIARKLAQDLRRAQQARTRYVSCWVSARQMSA
ncbi:hypothetical protein [Escherichia coli]|uniref:hypothetical protein n=1 Tax=Escherichia coli TaxID=562 RepID=UPI003B67EA7B